jgi:putative transposase
MRKRRFLVPPLFDSGTYHVISRVNDRQMKFGPEEKTYMIGLLRRYAEFSGIRVLTFCVMGNHFHWLLEVPRRPADAESITDEALVTRVRKCQGKAAAHLLQHDLAAHLQAGETTRHTQLRARWLARMWNLSSLVQSVKQRFSVWFNQRHQRRGTLWEERFKSTILLGPQAIATCAAYIDLNPVRAKLVEDPKDYPHSGYGMAEAGDRAARQGLHRALVDQPGALIPSEGLDPLAWYRRWIYNQGITRGSEPDPATSEPRPIQAGFSQEQATAEIEKLQPLPPASALMERVRYFSDGLVLGTRETVSQIYEATRHYFGTKRDTGPRKMRGAPWGPLRSIRDLKP